MRKTYLILSGGLGNQMFMFASAYALSKLWGHQLILFDYWFKNTKQRGRKFKRYTREMELYKFEKINLELPKPVFSFQAFIYQTTRILSKLNYQRFAGIHFDRDHLDIERRFDKDLMHNPASIMFGLYQSYFYFKDFRTELLSYFKLSEIEENEIREMMNQRRKIVGRLVMVHVRREDSLVPGNQWTGLLAPSYFNKCREKLRANKNQLVVFSDDPNWCLSKPEFSESWIVQEPDPVRTLRMMSFCDDYLIAGSTLSWWGAWLSESINKRVIAPFPFYKDLPTDLEKHFIPEQWERIPAEFGS
jgi:hypothetical protein